MEQTSQDTLRPKNDSERPSPDAWDTPPYPDDDEVDDSVADSPNSVVYDEAENLLHVGKACLLSMLVSDEKVLKGI